MPPPICFTRQPDWCTNVGNGTRNEPCPGAMAEREGEPTPIPATPREAACEFIRDEIRAGATLEFLLEQHPSSWRQQDRYSATVGGTIFNALGTPEARWLPLDIDQVGVFRLGGRECWGVFPL